MSQKALFGYSAMKTRA